MERLFDFMKNHILQLASDVPDHLTCTICKKVLVDSHIATNCGCKFCLKCITDYLLDGCKQCPSGKKGCSDVILDLKMDIAKDVASNVLISNLLICCPHENCGHQCRLREMPDHVVLCTNRPVECEFSSVGCEERLAVGDDMANHLVTENIGHTRLLLGHLRQMVFRLDEADELLERRNGEWQREKNELLRSMREMKEEINEAKAVEQHTANELQRIIRENEELEIKIQCQKRRMEVMETKLNENERNVATKLREEIEKIVKKNEEILTKTFREEMENVTTKLKEEMERKAKDVDENVSKKLREEMEKKAKDVDENVSKKLREEMERKAKDVDENVTNRLKEEMAKEVKRKMEDMESQMNENMENVTKKLREEIEKKVEEVVEDRTEELREEITDEIERNQDEQTNKIQKIQEMTQWGEFVWRVEKISDKRREAADGNNQILYSEYFFSHRNGYRMRLQMYPNGKDAGKGTHLSLYFRMGKGPFDDVLKWPMTKKIRLAIVNPKTGDEHIGRDYSYDKDKDKCAKIYQKPIVEIGSVGHPQFISWDKLRENVDVLCDDVMFIKCSLAD